jgi:hypothetical protein
MEGKKIDVFYHSTAKGSISRIGAYIEMKGYPETAEKFTDRLYEFGDSLGILPEKYPLCHFQKFLKYLMHCAVFEKNYVFVYKIISKRLVIYNVVHIKALS